MKTKRQKVEYIEGVKKEYERVRELRGNRKSNKKYLTLKQARENKIQIDWKSYKPFQPKFKGVKVFEDYSLEELTNYIDWTPFFSTWQLRGKFPAILEDEIIGQEAQKLYNDATKHAPPNH